MIQPAPAPCPSVNIEQTLDRYAEEARKGCGCSFEVYIDRFSASVDGLLATLKELAAKKEVFRLARESGYQTRYEIARMQRENLANGRCIHGIDIDCCPAGCGG